MQAGVLMRRVPVAAAALLLLVGCAAAARPPAPGPVAVSATAAGVEVVATPGMWRGWPADLSRVVTPIHVRVVNRGTVPLRIYDEQFALVLASGRRLASMLPQDVRGVVYDPPPGTLPSAGFSVGAPGDPAVPDWVLKGPALGAGADPVARTGEQFALPTPHVLDRALREGVLEPGETVSGFVYFERSREPPGPADLTVRLIDAGSGESLGRVVVPLAHL
jgi:hypothetical protein